MKCLLMSLALLSAGALACPGDDAKSATAPAAGKDTATAAKTTPAAERSTAAAAPSAKATVKVAAKPTAEGRKSSPL